MSVVVIGAGLAGLSAAITLQEAGVDVEVFEASDRVGGRVTTDIVDGFRLDRGFQLINSGYSELRRLDVISDIEFVAAERTIDVVLESGVASIGDPRKNISSIFSTSLAKTSEKFALLRFLNSSHLGGLNLESALQQSGTGDLYSKVLRPFLEGVFLTPLANVDAEYGREIIRTFIKGDSGLPRYGAASLSEALAARVNKIHLDSAIGSLQEFSHQKVILATDSKTASHLLGREDQTSWASCTTWYHRISNEFSSSTRLRIDGRSKHPVLNSIVISNSMKEYAPAGSSLLATTTFAGVSEAAVKSHLAELWMRPESEMQLIACYEIQESLPIFTPGFSRAQSSQISDSIFVAGDYLTSSSQNGALLSGRLAAEELLAN